MKNKPVKYELSDENVSFVSEEALQVHAQLTPEQIADWLIEYSEFIAMFQTEDDYRNSLKAKGNKYGDYTEHVIQETMKIRKGTNS